MKSLFFLVLIAILLQTQTGQTEPAPKTGRVVTEKELADSLRMYQSIASLDVTFKQTKILKNLDLQLKSEGRLQIFRTQHRIIWQIFKPSPVVVQLDQKEIRIESGVGKDLQKQVFKISDAPSDKATQSIRSLVTWLNLDATALAEQYSIFALKTKAYRFIPKEKSISPFQGLDMYLAEDGQLNRLVMNELSGDSLDIEFGKPRLTQEPKQSKP